MPHEVALLILSAAAISGNLATGTEPALAQDPLERLLQERPDDPEIIFLVARRGQTELMRDLVRSRPEPIHLARLLDQLDPDDSREEGTREIAEIADKWRRWESDNGFPLLVRSYLDARRGAFAAALDALVEAAACPRCSIYLDESRQRWVEALERAEIEDVSCLVEMLSRKPLHLRRYLEYAATMLLAFGDELCYRADFAKASRCYRASCTLGQKLEKGGRNKEAVLGASRLGGTAAARLWEIVHLTRSASEKDQWLEAGRSAFRREAVARALGDPARSLPSALASLAEAARAAGIAGISAAREATTPGTADFPKWQALCRERSKELRAFAKDVVAKGEWPTLLALVKPAERKRLDSAPTPMDALADKEEVLYPLTPSSGDVIEIVALLEPQLPAMGAPSEGVARADSALLQEAAYRSLQHWIGDEARGPLLARLSRLGRDGGAAHGVASTLIALGETGGPVVESVEAAAGGGGHPAPWRGLARLGDSEPLGRVIDALEASLERFGAPHLEETVALFFAARDLTSGDFELDLETWQAWEERLQAPLLDDGEGG
ncbi:MAG: hypothetical protein AB1486_02730 [Planctomycetota bacterium]